MPVPTLSACFLHQLFGMNPPFRTIDEIKPNNFGVYYSYYVQLHPHTTKNGSQSGAVLVSKSEFVLSDVTLNGSFSSLPKLWIRRDTLAISGTP